MLLADALQRDRVEMGIKKEERKERREEEEKKSWGKEESNEGGASCQKQSADIILELHKPGAEKGSG